jgi:hypothetical protein
LLLLLAGAKGLAEATAAVMAARAKENFMMYLFLRDTREVRKET